MIDEEKIVLGNGIYAVYVAEASGKWQEASGQSVSDYSSHSPLTPDSYRDRHLLLKGMMSIGFRPTVDGKKKVIEVNIFDFDKEIYGNTIRVYVKKYLRPEIKFDNLDELVKQIDQDKVESLKVL
jgi:riboflavin kinase/FMN adenylyltransferase